MAKRSSILLNLLNFNSKKISSIVSGFNDIEEIFKATSSDLKKIAFLTDSDVEMILKSRESDIIDRELELIKKNDIICLDIFDKNYPSFLKEIGGPPLVLYVKGNVKVLDKVLFAIVGTRMPTNYGISMARKFSYSLASLGVIIVSGLAKGIDTAAHQAAIEKGETVAVLGSGLLNIYPRENKGLAEAISRKGALVSELPLFAPPSKENFPRRNRIVSGLSKGVLVVEAPLRSGALITARLACEQNREVFAFPGNIDSPLSKGTHSLIKEGAKLVDSLTDILEELDINIDSWRHREEPLLTLKKIEPLVS